MTTPTRDDYIYAAGLLDGEGSIIIRSQFVKRRAYASTVLRVTITNTYLPIHTWLTERWGGHVSIRTKRQRDGFIRKPIGEWILTSRAAGRFLSAVVPFMKIKRLQAENALILQSLKRQPGRTRGLTAEDRRAELTCVSISKALNG